MTDKYEFSKYERARIVGARALQLSMDAPLLMKMEGDELENLHYDPLKIAQKELDSGVLPITVNRPMPSKREEALKELKVEELEAEEKQLEEKSRSGEDLEEPSVKQVSQDVDDQESDEDLEGDDTEMSNYGEEDSDE